MRYNYDTSVTLTRLSDTTADQSAYSAVPGTILGFFSPVSKTMAIVNGGVINQEYQFVTDGSADIRDGDKMVINGIAYGVKGSARFKQLSQDILVCSIFKEITL